MSEQPGNGDLRITLKDLYLAQQEFSKQRVESDKRLSDILSELKVTLVQIQVHMGAMDARNAAADQLHQDHSQRILDLERLVDQQGLRTIRSERESILLGMETRFDRLEKGVTEEEAVRAYKSQAGQAKTSARNMFWGMMVAVGTAIAALVAVVVMIIQLRGR